MPNTILKGCPFCGCTPKIEEYAIPRYSGCFTVEVICPNCGATRRSCQVDTNYSKTLTEASLEAINAWNERAHRRKRASDKKK